MASELAPARDLDEILDRGALLWEGLREASVFVTGGTGFFGRWLLAALTRANDVHRLRLSVTVLTRGGEYRDRVASASRSGTIRFVIGDVRTFEYPQGSYRFFVHAAAESARPVPDAKTHETIVGGTARCLDFAARHGAERFLFVSSGSVYGRQPVELERVPESYAENIEPPGLNAYGAAKRAAERLVTGKHPFATTIARGFAFVGPHLPLDRHFAIGNFIRDAIAGGPIVVSGDGTPVRSYLYSADLVLWLLTILLRGQPSRAYNVGSEDAISIADLARLVAGIVRPGTGVEILGTPGGGPPTRYVPSTERARGELGLRVWTPLPEGIRRTASWYSSERVES